MVILAMVFLWCSKSMSWKGWGWLGIVIGRQVVVGGDEVVGWMGWDGMGVDEGIEGREEQ